AHMVRPDVVLQALTLAALLALLRVGPRFDGDLLSGLALGLAGAVKFTAVFLVPSYLARRLAVPGPRGRGALLGGAVALDRFLLPALSVAFVLAGAGAEWVAGGRRGVLALVAVVAAALPLLASLAYLRGVVAPSTRDRALDAVEAAAGRGSLVVSSVERLGLDPFHVEVMELDGLGRSQRAQIEEADFVVSTESDDAEALAGLEKVREAEPVDRWNGPGLTVWRVPASLHPARRRLPLEPAWLSASENPAELPQAVDGRDDK